jgi:sec-independent protein translocase protein TatA
MEIGKSKPGGACTPLGADYETYHSYNILKEDSMFGIGLPELTILLVLVLIVFGAGKLPAIGAGVGKSIRNFKSAVSDSDKNSEENESQQITP